MLELLLPALTTEQAFLDNYKIDISNYQVQNHELYSAIYLLQAHRFKVIYEILGTPVYYTLAVNNYEAYLREQSILETYR